MSLGERIKSARIMAQLSQRQLANAAEISPMAISKYERDMDIPGSAVLLRLAKALGIKIEYFFRPTTVAISLPPYRWQEPLPPEQSEHILERVQEWLERYLDIEHLLHMETHFPMAARRRVESLDTIEEIALDLREEWCMGQGSIEGLVEVCEDHGIKIWLFDELSNFDILTLRAERNIPVFVVPQDMPGDYQRLRIAREIGYLILETAEHIDLTKAANRFARALLAPQPAVKMELGSKRHVISTYELHLLKHKYGLSMQAWIERARELDILSEQNALQLTKLFQQRHWDLKEPGIPLAPEIPQRFNQLIMHAFCEGIISQARATELLDTHPSLFLGGEIDGHGGLPIELYS